ncbi:MAG: nickel-dependent lactate racemase [Chloroflexi bacterium]|nr:nickel-dependent lactate racemase [Chloroflexota bacterium]
MRVELAYGQERLSVQVPDHATVLRPHAAPGLADECQAIREALRNPLGTAPLRELVKPSQKIVILFSDITRPMPSDRVLPVLLEALEHIPREQITLMNAVGTHRANTPQELEHMLGSEIAHGYRILTHDAFDAANLVNLGTSSQGNPQLVNRIWHEADFKIATGFIQPHIFAGFSGGPKAVLPGVAGFETIMPNHGYAILNNPRATWGVTEGNPVAAEMRELALKSKPDFLLNVTSNRDKEICAVFAGEMLQAHRAGIEFVRRTSMAPFDEPFDIVVTSNDGYPADINLYQSVKGMSAAAQIVKPGGAIIIAAECRDGVPDNGQYRKLVERAGSLAGMQAMLSQPGFQEYDQWQVQLQAGVMAKADVYVYSELADADVRSMLLNPTHSVETTLDALLTRYGADAKVCVMPEGPLVIPYLAQQEG